MSIIGTLVICAGAAFLWAPWVLNLSAHLNHKPRRIAELESDRLRLTGCWVLVFGNVLAHEWAWTAWWIAIGVAYLIFWWHRRRRRRRTLAALGAKARALRDALVRRMREVTKPRPVLKPQRMPV